MSVTQGNSIRNSENNRKNSRPNSFNSYEKLVISSGSLLLIDQFMLGNSQFTHQLDKDKSQLISAVKNYGGSLVDLENGEYYVFRNPMITTMGLIRAEHYKALCEEHEEFDFAKFAKDREGQKIVGHVFVDTRCFALCDAEVLKDKELLEEYASKRKAGDDKKARDLLRSKNVSVRYGFNRYGDELAVGVSEIDGFQLVLLWPDICEDTE